MRYSSFHDDYTELTSNGDPGAMYVWYKYCASRIASCASASRSRRRGRGGGGCGCESATVTAEELWSTSESVRDLWSAEE